MTKPRGRRKWLTPALAIAAFLCGLLISEVFRHGHSEQHGATHDGEHDQEEHHLWYCSMCPQIKQPQPGICAICGMDLVPLEGNSAGARALVLTPEAQALAGIELAQVEQRFVNQEVHMVGRVEFDKHRVDVVNAWVKGLIEEMTVDFRGTLVKTGQPLAVLSSPEMLSAQQYLIDTDRAFRTSPSTMMADMRRKVMQAKERLKIWNFTEAEISDILRRGTATDRLILKSEIDGVVTDIHTLEGEYAVNGAPLYTVADLSRVWIKLNGYEADFPLLRYGHPVSFEAEAYPGQVFHGRIVYIDPVLDPKTRTLTVRLAVDNEDLKLRPDMFVRATLATQSGQGDQAFLEELAGKWICSRHPEVVSGRPGTCPEGGMALVATREFGYLENESGEAPLVIPETAPLVTGRRAVVYVADKNQPGHYEGRDVLLGPKAGGYYIVREGLEAGEWIVRGGTFKLDSELQIQAKTSMMYNDNLSEEHVEKHLVPAAFLQKTEPLFTHYAAMSRLLSQDDQAGSLAAAAALKKALEAIDDSALSAQAAEQWRERTNHLKPYVNAAAASESIATCRDSFFHISQAIAALVESFGLPKDHTLYRYHCPMAFDNTGADWFQAESGIANPYFGSSMFACGTLKETIKAEAGANE